MGRYKKLWMREGLLLAIIAGIFFGLFLPHWVPYTAFLGEIFLILLRMMVLPLVAVSIFTALAQQKNFSNLSRLGRSTFFYYFLTSSLACLTGIICSRFFLFTALPAPQGISAVSSQNSGPLTSLILDSLFSENIFAALVQNKILPIVMVSIIFGVAASYLKTPATIRFAKAVHGLYELIMLVMSWIMFLMPLGVFGLLSTMTAKINLQIFHDLAFLSIAITLAVLVHVLVNLPLIAYIWKKINVYKYFYQVREALIVAFVTASSSATLPISTSACIEKGEVDSDSAGFVLPLGATLNMDGSAIYQALVVLYLAQLSGIELDGLKSFMVFTLVMLSSAGSAGIPGGGIASLTIVLQILGIPLEYLGIYILLDRFWDYPITAVNVAGDLVGAKIVSVKPVS